MENMNYYTVAFKLNTRYYYQEELLKVLNSKKGDIYVN